MWNWLKRLLGMGQKEYHHLLDDAHKLHADFAEFIARKHDQAEKVRGAIVSLTDDLSNVETVRDKAATVRTKLLNAISQ